MQWWHIYALTWATATTAAALLTAAALRLAPRLGIWDRPWQEEHKQHIQPVATMGGLAMVLAWLATVGGGIVMYALAQPLLHERISRYLAGVPDILPRLAAIAGGALAISLLGLADDRLRLRASVKLTGQILIAALVAAGAVRITLFWDNPLLTWLITIAWIVTVINAINFLDNMDTLAGGTALIAAAFFTFVAALRGEYFVACLGITTAGVCCGFLPFNVPPARIFMGDAGSQFLGFMLAVLGALTTFYMPSQTGTVASLLIPLLVLGVPLFDLVAVVVIRLHRRQPIYEADHRHISHRFARMGLSRGKAAMTVHLLTLTLCTGAVTILWLPPLGTAIIFVQAVAVLTVISFLQFHLRVDT